MLKEGNFDLLPIVFRLYYDLYEKCENENEIVEEIKKYDDFCIAKELQGLITELNPRIEKAYKLLGGALALGINLSLYPEVSTWLGEIGAIEPLAEYTKASQETFSDVTSNN